LSRPDLRWRGALIAHQGQGVGQARKRGVFARVLAGLPEGLPLSYRPRGNRHLLATSPDPRARSVGHRIVSRVSGRHASGAVDKRVLGCDPPPQMSL